jgi:hypothetical protein
VIGVGAAVALAQEGTMIGPRRVEHLAGIRRPHAALQVAQDRFIRVHIASALLIAQAGHGKAGSARRLTAESAAPSSQPRAGQSTRGRVVGVLAGVLSTEGQGWLGRATGETSDEIAPPSHAGDRFPPEIIAHAVRLYFRGREVAVCCAVNRQLLDRGLAL